MVCKNESWVPMKKRRSAGQMGLPCQDDLSVGSAQCSADRGHCNQFTVKGTEMNRDCAGTCGQYIIGSLKGYMG